MLNSTKIVIYSLLLAAPLYAETYYVSPNGLDTNSGLTPGSAWQTVGKVNESAFNPGDTILFECGGQWRESLEVTVSGEPGNPITFASYGSGTKPLFLGSEALVNGDFEQEAGTTYRIAVTSDVTSALVDGEFLLGGTPISSISSVNDVKNNSNSWFWNADVLYVNTGGTDPRTDGRIYTAVLRDDIISALGCSNLVFRNLRVEESARYNAGYGVLIGSSADILMEDCEALRCGKHHFGVINSTGFVGRRLYGAYAMPAQGNGGASTFVSYSDSGYQDTTSEWLDCVSDNTEDAYTGKSYPAFLCHGPGMGSVLVSNMTSVGGSISMGTETSEKNVAITLVGGHLDNGTLAVNCSNGSVSGLHISGAKGEINIAGDENVIENCLVEGGIPQGGFNSVITCRGDSNVIRFCTIVMSTNASDASTCIALTSANTHTHWYGNIMIAAERVFKLWDRQITASDVEYADYNFYNPDAEFKDSSSTWTALPWAAMGHDANSQVGDPEFVNIGSGDFRLSASSACIDAVTANPYPGNDFDDVFRPLDGDTNGVGAADIGAFEYANPDADSDGDGFNDSDEVISGTNAGDPFSKLSFSDIQQLAGSVCLTWIGGSSATQLIEYNTNMSPPSLWEPVYTNLPPTPITNELLTNPSSPAGFYRLRIDTL